MKRLIYFSACHVFQQDPLDEELDERRAFVGPNAFPTNAPSFWQRGRFRKGLKKGLDTVILHPTSIIGPYDFKPSLVGKALVDLYNGLMPSLMPEALIGSMCAICFSKRPSLEKREGGGAVYPLWNLGNNERIF